MGNTHAEELSRGERFEFGANWAAFLDNLNDERIAEAESSLKTMLGVDSLEGKRFLDIGSGSGLFSLAAKRLGAQVHSFDFDPKSVGCARKLKERYFKDDPNWTIEEGSVLDEGYIRSLGSFDIVYSWGVLHHTGAMYQALDHAMIPVADNGQLFIAIYNDQAHRSRFWAKVKKMYCANAPGKGLVCLVFIPFFTAANLMAGLLQFGNPFAQFTEYKKQRGMSITHDWYDWLGGYPFEVAKPEEILYLYRSHGYELEKLATTNGLGCNQFVFRKRG
jgi:2-polyprenyl-6-hydroxyphenyl methylase/3-demethylubiquinone-9 3-methyltransferase